MSRERAEAVFWDVGGVIIDIESIGRAQELFIRQAVETYDLEESPEEARSIWRDRLREHFAGREGLAYRTTREGRRKAAEALFDGDPPSDWEDRYRTASSDALTLNPGAVDTMARIHDSGCYQAIVSDADAGLSDRLSTLGIDEYVEHVTTSEEVGYVKPDRRMFETAFEKARSAGVDPDGGVMIGDKYENDMEGASRHGLTTVAFGAEDGPAVDHRIEELPELLDVVGVDRA